MLLMGDSRTQVKIISAQSDAIREAILEQIDRGVTIFHGEGGYTRDPSEVLLSVVSNRELPKLEKLVHSIDPGVLPHRQPRHRSQRPRLLAGKALSMNYGPVPPSGGLPPSMRRWPNATDRKTKAVVPPPSHLRCPR